MPKIALVTTKVKLCKKCLKEKTSWCFPSVRAYYCNLCLKPIRQARQERQKDIRQARMLGRRERISNVFSDPWEESTPASKNILIQFGGSDLKPPATARNPNGRPKKFTTRTVTKSIQLPYNLFFQICEYARAHHLSRPDTIRLLIEKSLSPEPTQPVATLSPAAPVSVKASIPISKVIEPRVYRRPRIPKPKYVPPTGNIQDRLVYLEELYDWQLESGIISPEEQAADIAREEAIYQKFLDDKAREDADPLNQKYAKGIQDSPFMRDMRRGEAGYQAFVRKSLAGKAKFT